MNPILKWLKYNENVIVAAFSRRRSVCIYIYINVSSVWHWSRYWRNTGTFTTRSCESDDSNINGALKTSVGCRTPKSRMIWKIPEIACTAVNDFDLIRHSFSYTLTNNRCNNHILLEMLKPCYTVTIHIQLYHLQHSRYINYKHDDITALQRLRWTQ